MALIEQERPGIFEGKVEVGEAEEFGGISGIIYRTGEYDASNWKLDELKKKLRVNGGLPSLNQWVFSEKDEDDFKHFTMFPDLVSVMKVVQNFQGLEKVERDQLIALVCSESGEYVKDGLYVAVASDVMVGVSYAGDTNIVFENKPEMDTREQLFEELHNKLVLTDPEFDQCPYPLELRVRCGLAAVALNGSKDLRGMSGISESWVLMEAFLPEEIALYIYGLEGADGFSQYYGLDLDLDYMKGLRDELVSVRPDLQERYDYGLDMEYLLKTNMGLRWEDPLLVRKIQYIDGVSMTDESGLVERTKEAFFSRIKGAPEEVDGLIKQTYTFAKSGSRGSMTAKIHASMCEMGMEGFGYWERWRAES